MLGKSKNIWSSGEKQKQVVLVQAFLKASPCRQLSHMSPFCAFDLRESQMCQSSRALERLMVVYFWNVIHSVSPYLNERPTWVCISLNSLGPISDRTCYRADPSPHSGCGGLLFLKCQTLNECAPQLRFLGQRSGFK